MAPSRTSGGGRGGPSQSSSASGVFFQGDGLNSQLNSVSSISGAPASSARPASGGHANRAVQSAANSGPSVGASSLVTDANSALSGGPHLQRSASINTESYLRLPASPMSFSSNNNLSISGSSVVDGSSVVQPPPQGSHQDQCARQMQQQQQGVASTATSQLNSQIGQILGNNLGDQSNLLGLHKKPRLDLRQEEIYQQLLQRHDSFQTQGHNPQLQGLIQQQRLLQQRQQQQILQSMSQMQPVHVQQQQMLHSIPQLKQHMQQQQHSEQPAFGMKHPYYSGICARRLMQYLYHLRQRPPDNSILYWRKFVAEYFAPRAKKRWCLSLYDNFGHYGHGVFPQSTVDAWQCDICGSKPGRGFETTFEVLPRLNKIKFDSGVIDELLFVDLPYERRLPSGLMVLEYQKATQESVYEHLRVVREGQLRIIFAPDLKMLSWEFCARRHEELLPRRLVAPQVHHLLQVAQKYQTAVNESGSGVPVQDLQTNCNMFLTAGRQLARNLDSQSLNELGFSKRYVRCLQISEVVSSMKDLIEFSREHKMGPIESLKNYPRQAAAAMKLQTPKLQEMERMMNFQGLSSDPNSLNKLMAMNPSLCNHFSSNVSIGAPNSSAQAAITMGGYQNLLRQSSVNANHSSCQPEASCSTSGSNQTQSMPFQTSVSCIPISMQISSVDSILRPREQNLLQQNQHSSHANQHPQQVVIPQILQEMICNNGAMHQPLVGQNAKGNITEDMHVRTDSGMTGFGNGNIDMPNNAAGMIPPRANSFKTSSNNSTGISSNAFKSKPDGPQNHQLMELVPDIHHDFAENSVFNSELGDLNYDWKF